MQRTTLAGLVAAMLVGGAGVWAVVRSADKSPATPASAEAGPAAGALRFYRDPTPVPPVELRDLDGRAIVSAGWKGKVILVNFWATWCPPCREEIPALVALQEKYRDQLQIIGISEDEGSIDGVRRFAAARRINYPIVMLTPELERTFPGVNALPTTFVVDREGRVVQKHVGMLNPTLTERETRALAGMDVNAAIELVDRGKPAKLENAAQVTNIPGIDLRALSPEQRVAAMQKLNAEGCTCGCDLTVARCRVDDPDCGTSLPLARQIVAAIK